MFTGIIQNLGEINTVEAVEGGGSRWTLSVPSALPYEIGESVSVNGCCLTVTGKTTLDLKFDLSPETLKVSTAGNIKPGRKVNLERAVRAGDPMGGHYVAGHVDAVGTVLARRIQGDGCEMDFQVPAALRRYIANKGSVSVDGVSLTPFGVVKNQFTVALIPHTLEETDLGDLQVGESVNIEVDLLARYVQRLMEEKS